MSGLFSQPFCSGFGPDRLRPDGDNPVFELVAATRRSELRQRVRDLCPHVPGVYGMLDGRGVLIYVGKAKRLRQRLLSYFRPGSRQEKAGRIIERARTVIWEPAPSEFSALLRELELIRRWRPGYNVKGMPGRERFIYLCLGRKPAPYAYATREPTGKELAVCGPIKGGALTREAARRINDLFHLRDCPERQVMRFAEQKELFPVLHAAGCLRFDLGTCSGPCAAFTTQGAYGRQVRAARAFLNGDDLSALHRLESEMAVAAAALQYERAALLRDKLDPLRWLRERLDWLDAARWRHSFIYPVPGMEGPALWYLIRQGRVCQAVAIPSDDLSRRAAATAIESVYDRRNLATALAPVNQVDHVLLVAAWFRKFTAERAKALTPEEALERCRKAAA